MRWKTKITPQEGDERFIKKFLWLPKEIDYIVRWLEFAHIRQRFVTTMWFGEYGPEDWSHWVDWEWLDLHQ